MYSDFLEHHLTALIFSPFGFIYQDTNIILQNIYMCVCVFKCEYEYINVCEYVRGFPGDSGSKEPVCQCRRGRRCRFDLYIRKISWNRKWHPTPVFLAGKSHRQRSLAGYSPGATESQTGLSGQARKNMYIQMLRYLGHSFLACPNEVISPCCHSAGTSEPGGGKDTIALAELTFQSGAGLATEGVKNEADGKSLQTMAVTRLIMLPTQKCEHRCPRILCALTGYSCLS